mmetsp:Transcript_45149/g.143421  ORF Transcript_45149/g.143421 Transcript_45149/m.143421 type:complete len:265 (+) Transcript_45149:470-1264(+)
MPSSCAAVARLQCEGTTPQLMSAALRAMSPVGSCRKIPLSSTRGTRGEPSKSCSTAPGPTEGSWFASPTKRTTHSSRSASRKRAARWMSSIDASSITTASAGSGLSLSRRKAFSCGLNSSSRWIVLAGRPTDVESTEAARAVGQASITCLPCCRQARTTSRTVNVLPVPGPPVSTSSRPSRPSLPCAAASAPIAAHCATASRCAVESRSSNACSRPAASVPLPAASPAASPVPAASPAPACSLAGSLRRTAIATASSSRTRVWW